MSLYETAPAPGAAEARELIEQDRRRIAREVPQRDCSHGWRFRVFDELGRGVRTVCGRCLAEVSQ